MFNPLRLYLVIAVMEVLLILGALAIIIGDLTAASVGPLDLLHALASLVMLVAASVAFRHALGIFLAFRRILRTSSLEALELNSQIIALRTPRMNRAHDVVMGAIIANDLISAVRYFLDGDVAWGVFNVVVAALLLWILFLGGGRGDRRSVSKLLGDKTRALRDRLVDIQKGMQPSPNPA
ncbi:hypothetical protein DEO23_12260 [Brachybacterium endophyticum]|uniref:Uncharacterized protein n=1 Tax=Brachybacterium endophyticum TaxID=2182385 RepID=A0A2U2RHL1_9MICO|nr:hypothetical protein [Brachybacterium endophyticum]PWH05359.1 hypothetical protein DEO23_12260 [Brachybacterium endophyticum]